MQKHTPTHVDEGASVSDQVMTNVKKKKKKPGTGGPPGLSDGRLLAPGSSSLPGLSDSQQQPQSMSGAAPTGSADTADFTMEDMDAFRVFTSEMFDPSIFEGFGQSPVEGIPLATTGLWDGF